jgi:transcriptional regulator with XRE-family HTH domain
MNTVLSVGQEVPLGMKARGLRLALLLTQYRLAEMAGVPVEEVELFERNLPVCLDTRRKVLQVLWARKAFGGCSAGRS